MIDACRRWYMERFGHERWISELESALADALISRAEAERVRRQTPPDYVRINPVADLQGTVKRAVAGGE